MADHQNPPCPDLTWPRDRQELDLGEHVGKLFLQGKELTQWPNQLFISNRKASKAITLKQGKQHKSLKNLFQSASIPVWLRDSIPLCVMDGELVAVGDWNLSEKFKSWLSQNELDFSWQPGSPILQYIVAQQHEKMGGGDG